MKTNTSCPSFIKKTNKSIDEIETKLEDINKSITVSWSQTIKILRINWKKAEFIWLGDAVSKYIKEVFWVEIASNKLFYKWLEMPSLNKISKHWLSDLKYFQILNLSIKKPEFEIEINVYSKEQDINTLLFHINWFNKVWRTIWYTLSEENIEENILKYTIQNKWVLYEDIF